MTPSRRQRRSATQHHTGDGPLSLRPAVAGCIRFWRNASARGYAANIPVASRNEALHAWQMGMAHAPVVRGSSPKSNEAKHLPAVRVKRKGRAVRLHPAGSRAARGNSLKHAVLAQLAESVPSKHSVVGSNPTDRSSVSSQTFRSRFAQGIGHFVLQIARLKGNSSNRQRAKSNRCLARSQKSSGTLRRCVQCRLICSSTRATGPSISCRPMA